MLCAAGLAVEARPAGVDEAALKQAALRDGLSLPHTALMLAEAKARQVGMAMPERLIIGADQLLQIEDERLDKPGSREQLRAQLHRLRGREHQLISAVAVLRGPERLWATTDHARLRMRPFTDAFLDRYLEQEGEQAMQCVGGYRLEGLGAQLFEAIEGDYFTVLGLPLLPLLGYLRQLGILQT